MLVVVVSVLIIVTLAPLVMESNHTSTEPTTVFERELRDLILSAYGRSAAIEDIWEIATPISDAPDWRVTIEKIPPKDLTYEPSLLEE